MNLPADSRGLNRFLLGALAASVVASLGALPNSTVQAAVVAGYAESLCETVTPSACDHKTSGKPDTPTMITPITGVFTDQPRFEWRQTPTVEFYLLSVVEYNAEGAIIATFSRNITPDVRCIEGVCAVSSTALGFRLQPDAATFKYRLIASNDTGSTATPRTTVNVQ